LNVVSFAGSIYVNNAINGLVELLSYIVVAFSLDKLGRKWINGGFMIFGGVACLGCMALEEAARTSDDPAFFLEAQRWMAFAGKFCISCLKTAKLLVIFQNQSQNKLLRVCFRNLLDFKISYFC
jgi:hypothetical protein